MLKKLLNFIKYHNGAVLVLAAVFLLGTGVFASEPGQKIIGQKTTQIEGADNSVLLATDLNNFEMNFKIEKIGEQDGKYLVNFSCVDLVKKNNVWEYQMKEKQLKISQKTEGVLAAIIAKELKDVFEARVRDLKKEQEKAKEIGAQNRVEVTEYSGLIGKTLDLAKKVFPGYEPVRKTELPLAASLAGFRELPDSASKETDVFRINTNAPAVDYGLTALVQNMLSENASSTSSENSDASTTPAETATPLPAPEQTAETPAPSQETAPQAASEPDVEVIETN